MFMDLVDTYCEEQMADALEELLQEQISPSSRDRKDSKKAKAPPLPSPSLLTPEISPPIRKSHRLQGEKTICPMGSGKYELAHQEEASHGYCNGHSKVRGCGAKEAVQKENGFASPAMEEERKRRSSINCDELPPPAKRVTRSSNGEVCSLRENDNNFR